MRRSKEKIIIYNYLELFRIENSKNKKNYYQRIIIQNSIINLDIIYK